MTLKYQNFILRTTCTKEEALELGHDIVRKINQYGWNEIPGGRVTYPE